MKSLSILCILATSLLLAACGANSAIVADQTKAQPTVVLPARTPAPPLAESYPQPPQAAGKTAPQLSELTDNQGAVAVIVKPLDLGSQAEKLTFEVALNTHSVDLSMDLASLATLMTDTGLTVQADTWDAPRGGHHISGVLSFPTSVNGKSILDGASKLTLVLKGIDAPERNFTWDLK